MSEVRKNTDEDEYGGIYCVKDTLKILLAGVVAVIGLLGGIIMLVATGADPKGGSYGFAITLLIVGLIFFFVAKANYTGFILDFDNDIMEFPGGGVAANDIIDYFKPGFLLQMFKRYQLPISEIREISRKTERTRRTNSSGKTSTSVSHNLMVNGSFGAINLRFMSAGKRDELYSILREANEMGTPILNQ